ncbi:hypothetical protein BDF14DRAFT_1750303 [Spinellus fusiger]|nr:hypothetical protein BDF14DRAFT_1750303 [Spinellus fusiger]
MYIDQIYTENTKRLKNRNEQNRMKERTKPDLHDHLDSRAIKCSTQQTDRKNFDYLLRSSKTFLNTSLQCFLTLLNP